VDNAAYIRTVPIAMPSRVASYLATRGASAWLRTLEISHGFACGCMCGTGVAAAVIAVHQSGSNDGSSTHAVMLHSGAAVALLGALGLLGTHLRSLQVLTWHVTLLSIAAAAQLCWAVWLTVHQTPTVLQRAARGTAAEPSPPPLSSSLLGAMWASQLLALLLGCSLHAAYTQASNTCAIAIGSRFH
jgi:hypothetical protein